MSSRLENELTGRAAETSFRVRATECELRDRYGVRSCGRRHMGDGAANTWAMENHLHRGKVVPRTLLAPYRGHNMVTTFVASVLTPALIQIWSRRNSLPAVVVAGSPAQSRAPPGWSLPSRHPPELCFPTEPKCQKSHAL